MDTVAVALEAVEGVEVDGVEDEDVGVFVGDDELAAVGIADDAASGEVDVVEMGELFVDKGEDFESSFKRHSYKNPIRMKRHIQRYILKLMIHNSTRVIFPL